MDRHSPYALHHFYLTQRDDRHHWVHRTIAVTQILYIPHPIIHVSHNTSPASVPTLQYASRRVSMTKVSQSTSQYNLFS